MPRLEAYLKGFNTSSSSTSSTSVPLATMQTYTSTTSSSAPPKNYISSAPSSSSSSIGNTGKHYQEIHGDVQYESHSGASDSDSIEEEDQEEEEDDSEVAKLLLATQQVAENREYPSRLNSEEGRGSMQLNRATSSGLSMDRTGGKLSKTMAGRRRYCIYASPCFPY
jgi:hypothetical protein